MRIKLKGRRGKPAVYIVSDAHAAIKQPQVDPLTHQVKICDFGSAKVLGYSWTRAI
ncbi:hypothetical protein FCM35_KLT17036 [Carex littledalei]|uniref:Uncharacterized protein n=1 Tax=Carex littledalei TaxID=544730 RepID=A0A833RB27_9POAL|nr:hypothetical protein FCM35_KLT17036 [Carex littledalei]